MRKIIITTLLFAALSVPAAAQDPFSDLASLIEGSGLSQARQDELFEMLFLLDRLSQQSSTDFTVLDKLLDTLICHLHYALLFEGTSQEEADALADSMEDVAAQIVLGAFVNQFLPFPPVFPVPVPAAPAAACKVNILVKLGSSLGDPIGKFFTEPGKILSFEAQGMPGEGTFEWSLDPEDPNLAALATSSQGGVVQPRATFFAKRKGTYKVKVKYTDPTGAMCEDEVAVVVR